MRLNIAAIGAVKRAVKLAVKVAAKPALQRASLTFIASVNARRKARRGQSLTCCGGQAGFAARRVSPHDAL
jgi:hypothetical protein